MPVTVDIRCADCSRLVGFEIRLYQRYEKGETIYRSGVCGCLRQRAREIVKVEREVTRLNQEVERFQSKKGET